MQPNNTNNDNAARDAGRHTSAAERFFILTPKPTMDRGIYLDALDEPMKWSASFGSPIPSEIPAIGDQVFVSMNSIGPSIVKGYFESCGYVGLMVKPINPPAFFVENCAKAKLRWQREGIGCVFGAEIRPAPTTVERGHANLNAQKEAK